MNPDWKEKAKKINKRTIEVTIYDYDGQRMVVEGSLRDDRFQEIRLVTGEVTPPGAIHHMTIRLLVNLASLVIEDVDVEMIAFPRAVCRETVNCLEPIKGSSVRKGFTAKVKKLAGDGNGCTHLVELLLAMAPVIFQGFAAQQAKNITAADSEKAGMMFHFLLNTCYAWREDGPFAEMFRQKFNLK